MTNTDTEAEADVIVAHEDEAPAVAKSENVATDDQLAALKAQLALAADRERVQTERADRATSEATAAKTEQQKAIEAQFYAQDIAVANALAAAQGEAQSLEQEIERLATEGKAGELAGAMRRLARAEAKITDAERQKEWVERGKADYEAAQATEKTRREQVARAPVQPQVSDKAKAWIIAHPRMTTDRAYFDAAVGAHNLAKLKGIPMDSDEYFEFIEVQLGERTVVEEPDEEDAAAEVSPRRQRMVSAPPSRSTAQSREQRRVMTLSAQEREMADVTMRHITDPAQRYKRYAENKQRMLADNPLVQ